MNTEFTVQYITESERQKPKVCQKYTFVRVKLDGEMKLCDALIALIKTKYDVF